MHNDELQTLVDSLAERLERSVAIDDPTVRLLAASRHFGDEDPIRIGSVMNRAVSPEVADRIAATGVAKATGPIRVAVDVEGCLPRICVPVRCDGALLGYLWLIDEIQSITDAELGLAQDTAERAGAVLFRRLLTEERSRARHEAILRELVASDPAARARAVDDLRAEQPSPDKARHYQVMAVQFDAQGSGPEAPREVALQAAIDDGLRMIPDDLTMVAATRSRAWILLPLSDSARPVEMDAIAERISLRFGALSRGTVQLVTGLGSVVDSLEQVVDSYHQALVAAKAAERIPTIGHIAHWDRLGPYKIFLELPLTVLQDAAEVAPLAELYRRDTGHIFVETLEIYLDTAGDARTTADRLWIHRASLYHRLSRIEQITGCDLNNGYDRLTLHLGLKLRALAAALK